MDFYTTIYMAGVINQIKPNPTFFLDNYFTTELQHDTQEVAMDVVEDKPRITPYVHPLHQGQLVENMGYSTKTVSPAYLKDKRIHNPMKALRRVAGEPIGGSLTGEERMRMSLISDLNDQLNMFTRRQEVMALEVCLTGMTRIQGPGFDNLVDYGRAPALTETLKGDDQWDNEDLDLIGQIENFSDLVFDKSNSGAIVGEIIMDRKAWNLFRQNKGVKEVMNTRRGDASTIQLSPMSTQEGVQFKGWFGDYQVFVYKGNYIDSYDNTTKNYIPDYTAIFMSRALDGVRHYGAILDVDAQVRAMRYFPKTWKQEDPSARLLMLQSAPLLVPYDPNACMSVKVIDDGVVRASARSVSPDLQAELLKVKTELSKVKSVLKSRDKNRKKTDDESDETSDEVDATETKPDGAK